MKEPKISVRFNFDLVIHVDDAAVARIDAEGFQFLCAWESSDGFSIPPLWPSNFKAIAKALPALLRIKERVEDDLLDIQQRLNNAQAVAQVEIEAENKSYLDKNS